MKLKVCGLLYIAECTLRYFYVWGWHIRIQDSRNVQSLGNNVMRMSTSTVAIPYPSYVTMQNLFCVFCIELMLMNSCL